MIVWIGSVKSDCLPKYRINAPTDYFQSKYLDTFKERKPEKSYNISDRYKWVKNFNYNLPCGTMEYNPGLAIVNGTDATEKSWPWHVLVDFSSSNCGGVLIDAQWVLTVAHCVEFKDKNYTVYFGSRYRDFRDHVESRSATLVVLHEEYNNDTLVNDIALLKLNSPVAFTAKIRPACLPVNRQEFSLNDRCFITGYGERLKPGPKVLQQLRVYVVPDRECLYLWKTYHVIRDWRDICVGRVRQTGGICAGDSGSPLSCEIGNRYYVAGIASAGPVDCYSDILPDKYVKISQYIDWIIKTIDAFIQVH